MEATLQALGQILLKAVPTFLLVIFLNFYLKAVFFKPFRKMFEQRYEASEGARKLAEQSLERAAAKAAEYEAAVRKAKGEVYENQARINQQLQEQQESDLREARKQADAAAARAKADLAKDVEVAKDGLARESEMLAQKIAESILGRSAA
jgi:F-type H+-transporting ATPase subunit b